MICFKVWWKGLSFSYENLFWFGLKQNRLECFKNGQCWKIQLKVFFKNLSIDGYMKLWYWGERSYGIHWLFVTRYEYNHKFGNIVSVGTRTLSNQLHLGFTERSQLVIGTFLQKFWDSGWKKIHCKKLFESVSLRLLYDTQTDNSNKLEKGA